MANSSIRCILVPVDLSTCSRAALEFACSLAHPLSAKIQVLLVEQRAGHEVTVAKRELQHFVATVPGARHVELTEHVAIGDPMEHIVSRAQSEGCDVIVLGTHGRTGRARFEIGAVTDNVVRTAACPVVTVSERD